MDLRVGGVLKLLGDVGVAYLGSQLAGLADGSRHTLVGRCQYQFGTERLEQRATLNGHGVGHGQYQLVATYGRNISQADTRIARRRLYDGSVLVDEALALASFNEGQRRAVLDAPQGVQVLQFHDEAGLQLQFLPGPGQFQQRCVANQVYKTVCYL